MDTTTPPATTRRPRGSGAHARLRDPVTLPRRAGPLGDVSYVFTAIFGLAEARRELAGTRRELERERAQRDERLLLVARQAIADDSLTDPVAEAARERLAEIEDQRSRHAGAATAAEAEIEALRQDRARQAEDHAAQIAAQQKELAAIDEGLQPLERELATWRRKAAELAVTLKDLDRKIAAQESSLVTVKGARTDPAAVEATLASLRAEREAVSREEPVIVAELDALEPKIASLGAGRKDARRRIDELGTAEADAQIRVDEKLAAASARKAVEDRGVADADAARTRALRELGEALCVERPAALAPKLRAIDEHDVSIATLERRAIELHELVSGVDRVALARGLTILVLGAAALVGAIYLLLLR